MKIRFSFAVEENYRNFVSFSCEEIVPVGLDPQLRLRERLREEIERAFHESANTKLRAIMREERNEIERLELELSLPAPK